MQSAGIIPQLPHYTNTCAETVRWENYISISFQIEWYMIVVIVFLTILNQMEFHLVQKIESKTVTTIISHSMWKEMEL